MKLAWDIAHSRVGQESEKRELLVKCAPSAYTSMATYAQRLKLSNENCASKYGPLGVMNSSSKQASSIWTIVVTHNSEKVISHCLESLLASSNPTKVVVVDNDSKDETLNIVRRDFPSVLAIEAPNLGFAGGCNRGVRMAGDDADAYFFLNPDASVSPTCLGTLTTSLFQNEDFAILSPTVVQPETGEVHYAGARLDFQNLDFEVLVSGEYLEGTPGTIETGRPTGAAMLVRRTSMEEVGLMDDSYFLYWEECEWAHRFQRSGLRVGFVSDAVAFHIPNHSTGGIGSRMYEYYFTRNEFRLVSDAKGSSKLHTLRILLPQVYKRLFEFAFQKQFATLATALQYDSLGILDFLLGRNGHRRGLPPI